MAPRHRVKFVVPTKEEEGTRTEVLIETFIRKQLRLKAHTVTQIEETDECMVVCIDRLGKTLRHSLVSQLDAFEAQQVARQRAMRRAAQKCSVAGSTMPSSCPDSCQTGTVAQI